MKHPPNNAFGEKPLIADSKVLSSPKSFFLSPTREDDNVNRQQL
jgi:hypothetical protein